MALSLEGSSRRWEKGGPSSSRCVPGPDAESLTGDESFGRRPVTPFSSRIIADYIISTAVAMETPPPPHRVARPRLLPRFFMA